MLRDAFYIARMDAFHLLKRRETIIWTFVMPVLFFYFIGTITGNNIRFADARDALAVSVPADAGFLADQLLERLSALQYRIVPTASAKESLSYPRRLELPQGFTASILAGHSMRVRFSHAGQELDAAFDQMRIFRAVNRVLADLAVIRIRGANPTPESFQALAAEPRTLTLDVSQAGRRVDPPTGFEQSVPGTMVMFTLLVLFTSGAVSLTIERRLGILRRLASSPMSRGAVVLGKWGARMTVGVIQIGFAMIAGRVLFHVSWGPNLAAVMAILLAYGALAAALAMLLGNWGRTEGQVLGLGVILSNLMAGLGGCWWPIEITPFWAQKVAVFLPTGLTMNALHKLVNFGAPAEMVTPHLCALVVATAVALYVLARTLRFQ